ncbi:MAG TPA: D-cysteine desulfhydrase family protein [Dongiaceae bacterium]|jgi:D-cysteine desulfhydrase family pyridoxal phosphate-dependent enzyme
MRLDEFPRFPLIHAPTALEPLSRLQQHLAGPRLYIKRDDCTGLAFGGNKARKLEFLLGEAMAQRATVLVSAGGLQSNHVRQTAAAAAKAGLGCHLVLARNVPIDTAIYQTNGNLFLDRLLGATVHICGPNETRLEKAEAVMAELRTTGENPYFIPVGGSNGVGALGYAALMLELRNQATAQRLSIDRIVTASSSGGTQAGLAVGASLAMVAPPVSGIDVDGKSAELRRQLVAIAADCSRRLDITAPDESGFDLVSDYAAPGYGLPNPGTIEAIRLLASLEGIFLDPVYSGKAMAGLIDMIRQGRFTKDETIVFIHTGGAPALFAYTDIF